MTTLEAEPRVEHADLPARLAHQPALDGLRGLAVLLVVAYHLSVAPDAGPMGGVLLGGFLGVDVFFVLSGFLITSLLLIDYAHRGSAISLEFWQRRLRRLLPPVLVLLCLVTVYAVMTARPWQLTSIRNEGLATLMYFQNWYLIYGHSAGGSLAHTWSLAIEEQWYLVWPFLLAGLLFVFRGRRAPLVPVVGLLAAMSFAWMASLAASGAYHRAHSGTDTRASELLVGAGLAIVLVGRPPSRRTWVRVTLELVGIAALGGGVGMVVSVTDGSTWLFHGGYLLISVLAALVIAAATQPSSPVLGRALGWKPLAAVGFISYGVYLYHVPIILWITPVETGLVGVELLVVRVAVVLGVAVLSYVLIEQPIRRGRLTGRRLTVLATSTGAVVALLIVTTAGGRPIDAYDREEQYAARVASSSPAGSARVLLFGDGSVFDISSAGGNVVDSAGIRGLSVPLLFCDGFPGVAGTAAKAPPTCADWSRSFRSAIDGFDPAVSVLLVRAQVGLDRQVGSEMLRAGSPELGRLLRSRLEQMHAVMTADGAPMLLLMAPCDAVGPGTLGPKSPRAWVNSIWRAFADDHRGTVAIADPHDVLCPDGHAPALNGASGLSSARARAFWEWLAPIAARVGATGA